MNEHLHPIFRAILAPFAPPSYSAPHAEAIVEALESGRPFSDALYRWTIVRPLAIPANPRDSFLQSIIDSERSE